MINANGTGNGVNYGVNDDTNDIEVPDTIDKVVMAAYGFSAKMTEADSVAELMKLYKK